MVILNEAMEEITEYDLEKGCLTATVRIRPDAVPIDNKTKFVWDDTDYEEVLIYSLYTEEKETLSAEDTLLELTADHEYRLCMLELTGGETT